MNESHTFLFRVFVTGRTPKSQRALANLRAICEEELPGRYEIEVIDVLERPDLAEREKIMATPTLVRELPPPVRRVIGDFSDPEKVLVGLALSRPTNDVPPTAPTEEDQRGR